MNAFFVVAFATLQTLGATSWETRTLKSLLTPESHWTPTAVNGSCCGPWQTNHYVVSSLLGERVTCEDLQTKPEVAAKAALAALRENVKACKTNWRCGWRHGPYSETCQKDKLCRHPGKVKPDVHRVQRNRHP